MEIFHHYRGRLNRTCSRSKHDSPFDQRKKLALGASVDAVSAPWATTDPPKGGRACQNWSHTVSKHTHLQRQPTAKFSNLHKTHSKVPNARFKLKP